MGGCLVDCAYARPMPARSAGSDQPCPSGGRIRRQSREYVEHPTRLARPWTYRRGLRTSLAVVLDPVRNPSEVTTFVVVEASQFLLNLEGEPRHKAHHRVFIIAEEATGLWHAQLGDFVEHAETAVAESSTLGAKAE